MAQRYSSPIAHERMAAGLCPECGHVPDEHPNQPISLFNAGVCGFGGLLRRGVEERIEQFRADLAAGES